MISTALIHNFSPEIESQAAKKFVDPRHENKFFALTPAFKWHEGSLVFACKIWLKMVRFDNSFMPRPLNEFGDHHTYMQTFDKHLKPTSTAHLLGIHLRIQPGHYGNGPLDVRMYRVQNQLFLTIHGSYLAASGDYYDTQMIYDVREDLVYLPEIEGGSPALNRVVDPLDPVLRDKNWVPLIQNEQLYFVHNLDPLSVLKCSLHGQCIFVHQEYDKTIPYIGNLRGGTPFEPYSDNYYISIAHFQSTKNTTAKKYYYTAHVVVLHVNPYRVVYVSDIIEIDSHLYKDVPCEHVSVDDNSFFPISLLIENADSIVIGAHINDHYSVMLRMRGIKALMENVIEQDKQPPSPNKGPPVGYLRSSVLELVRNSNVMNFNIKE
jgi:hypothetical protein